MQRLQRSKRLISLTVTIVFLSSPLIAQQKRPATPRKPVAQAPAPKPVPPPPPTFDTLIAADTYRVYAEVRAVGQLIRSPAVTDLLDPVMKLGNPPKEFKSLLKWLNAQADALTGSRMLAAFWPTQPSLPSVVVAIEFASAEEAQKFHPKLRGFMPTLLPTPTPSPSRSATNPIGAAVTGTPSTPAPLQESAPALPPYHIKQSGSLVLISDKPFEFKDLVPRGSKMLSEDQNFATVRNRFSSESLFVYVDVKSIEKEQQEQLKKFEEEQKQRELEAANRPTPEEPLVDPESGISPDPEGEEMPRVDLTPVPESTPQGELGSTQSPATATLSASEVPAPEMSGMLMFSLYSAFFGGQSKWPEAIGAAVAFEGDVYVLRTLVINGGDNKGSAIPFVPQFVSGPALVPESPGVFPADTDLFVAASLDYPQVYEGMVKAALAADELAKKYGGRPASTAPAESPFAAYEKKLGLKIKDDVLPLLGNEIALALPKNTPETTKDKPESLQPTDSAAKKGLPAPPPDPTPVIAISIKDKEAVRKLIPKIIESFGLTGASLLAQTEKREDTEITSYAGVFSYAFVGDFLVLSADPLATSRVVDSFLSHQTLSSNSHFRNTIRWQPRQVLGQVYVAPDLVERYYPLTLTGTPGNDKMRDFLSRLSPVLDPVSYALTNDGLGPLHELHVPRNTLMLLVAGLSQDTSEPSAAENDFAVRAALRTLASAEDTFRSTHDDGHCGTLAELTAAGLIAPNITPNHGYRIEITVSGKKFEATAVPLEYGKSGWLSYFIDESGVVRGGDHGGGAATIADNPIR